ncbi:MAG: hypothetical protein ACLU4J_02635 [Butyricimonas paravirosa]
MQATNWGLKDDLGDEEMELKGIAIAVRCVRMEMLRTWNSIK